MSSSCDLILPFIKPGWVGVEIGVQWGVSALAFLKHGVRFMYLVDPWQNYPGSGYAEGEKWDRIQEEIFQECKSRLRDYDDGRHFAILRMQSDDAKDFIPTVDFVWVDGNHRYQDAKDDLENYWPKIRQGGILCGHDYGEEGSCEVKQAIDKFVYGKRHHSLVVQKHLPCWFIYR